MRLAFALLCVGLVLMTAGGCLVMASWSAPAINSSVDWVRMVGPCLFFIGTGSLILSCCACAIRQRRCCRSCRRHGDDANDEVQSGASSDLCDRYVADGHSDVNSTSERTKAHHLISFIDDVTSGQLHHQAKSICRGVHQPLNFKTWHSATGIEPFAAGRSCDAQARSTDVSKQQRAMNDDVTIQRHGGCAHYGCSPRFKVIERSSSFPSTTFNRLHSTAAPSCCIPDDVIETCHVHEGGSTARNLKRITCSAGSKWSRNQATAPRNKLTHDESRTLPGVDRRTRPTMSVMDSERFNAHL